MGVGIIGPAAGGGGVVKKLDTITSTGTWTAPNDCYSVDLTLVGGGGGGNCGSADYAGAGGGGGGYINRTINVTPGQTYTVTIGAGGSSGTSVGSMGGKTIFGSNLLVAYGGGPGQDAGFASPDREKHGGMGGRGFGSGADSFSGTGGGGASSTPGGVNASNYSQLAGPGVGGNQGYGIYNQGEYYYRTTPGGGKGINGLAGGGGGGLKSNSTDVAYMNLGKDGGGHGANPSLNATTYRTSGSNQATSGETNTGGGGGGGHGDFGSSSAKNGGSGVAIIEYWTAA